MNREYDLFEKFPDGSVLWRECVKGLEKAVSRLKDLAARSPYEHFAIHTPTKAVVARINVPPSDQPDPAQPEPSA